jgi:hypothetical protein
VANAGFDLGDLDQWPEYCEAQRLTDGIPAYPPTRGRVTDLLSQTGIAAAASLGPVPPRMGEATGEALAANAVMAGCGPAEFALFHEAMTAVMDPYFNLRGVQTTTHPCWPLVIVSGPVIDQVGVWAAESVFGGGAAKANGAIGRALRLALWNLGGAEPGEPVKEVFGHPGRYSFCIGERDLSSGSPWGTLAQESSLVEPGRSSVTVFACESPQSVAMWGVGDEPEQRLAHIANSMTAHGSNNSHLLGELLVVLSPPEARYLDSCGWTRPRIRDFLFETARTPLGELRPLGKGRPSSDPEHFYEWWPAWIDQSDDEFRVPVVETPTDIHLLVTGGDSIPWAAVCPGWGNTGGFAITRELPR